MTPEQTLEWLAQQHFDQCQEERPIQDWIRKMKSQLPAQPAVTKSHKQSTTCGEPVAKYSDIVSDGGLDPRNTTPQQPKEPEQEHEFENWLKNQFEWKNFYYKGTGPSEMAVNFAKKAFNAGQSMVNPYVPTERQRKPLTDEMVLAGAKALAKRHADSCGLDFDDVWKYYADEHKDDAKVVIEAAHGIKEKNT